MSLSRITQFFLFVIALTTVSAFVLPSRVLASSCGLLSSAPTVRVSSGASGQVQVSWDSVSGASSYSVVYGTSSGSYMYGGDPIGNAQTTSNTIQALRPGTDYYFRMIAKHDGCTSPWSTEVRAKAGMQGDTQEPVQMVMQTPEKNMTTNTVMRDGPVGRPMLWAKSGPSVGTVTLYWKDADSANDYHVMYGMSGMPYQYGALHIGSQHMFTIGQLQPGASYSFSLVPLFNGRSLSQTPPVTVTALMSQDSVQQTAPIQPSTMMKTQSYEPQQINEMPEPTAPMMEELPVQEQSMMQKESDPLAANYVVEPQSDPSTEESTEAVDPLMQ